MSKKRQAGRSRAPLIVALLAWSGLVFLAGLLVASSGLLRTIENALQPQAKVPTPLYTLETVDAPVLEIALSDEAYALLVQNRERILNSGQILITEPTDVLSATVRLGDDAPLEATVRLKGTQVTHVRDPKKWSLRIDISGAGTLLDMQHLTIHHPKERNYLDEWYYLRALEQEGLIALRYDFVRVTLHGEDLGIYAVEELPEARLLERYQRANAAVMRFDQAMLLKEWVTFGDALKEGVGTGSGTLAASDVQPFDADALLNGSAEDMATFAAGAALLEGFRRGELSASQVFDVPLMARFLALTDLFGSWHGLNWNNLRLYYNPQTERIEPIGYDTNAGDDISDVGLIGQGIQQFEFDESRELIAKMFADQTLARTYVQELERVSDPAWLEAFFAGLQDETQRNYSLLYSEFPSADYTTTVYTRNAEYIRKVLDPNTAGVHAYVASYAAGDGGGATITLQLGNLFKLPVEPLALSYNGQTLTPVPTFAAVVLPARSGQVQYVPVTYEWPADVAWSEEAAQQLTFTYHLLGTADTNRHTVSVLPWPYTVEDASASVSTAAPLSEFAFLDVDDEAKTISILSGTWAVTRTLEIPAGYEVRCGPGTTLNLSAGVDILSRSRLVFIGDEAAPIVLQGEGAAGGLAVIEAAGTSILQEVTCAQLGAPALNGIAQPAALTFVGTAAELRNCQLVDVRAESAVGLLHSEAQATGLFVVGAAADAVVVRASRLDAADVQVQRAAGVALTASEGSAVTLDGLTAEDCAVGLASTGSTTLDALNVALTDCERELAVEDGSAVTLDGQVQTAR